MNFLEMFGDLEKTGRQVQEFITAAMTEIRGLKAETVAMREELSGLRTEHAALHAKHEAIFGWLSGLDEEELQEVAAGVEVAAAEAAASATVAEAAATATVAVAEEIAPPAGEPPPVVVPEVEIPEETAVKPEKKKRGFLSL